MQSPRTHFSMIIYDKGLTELHTPAHQQPRFRKQVERNETSLTSMLPDSRDESLSAISARYNAHSSKPAYPLDHCETTASYKLPLPLMSLYMLPRNPLFLSDPFDDWARLETVC